MLFFIIIPLGENRHLFTLLENYEVIVKRLPQL